MFAVTFQWARLRSRAESWGLRFSSSNHCFYPQLQHPPPTSLNVDGFNLLSSIIPRFIRLPALHLFHPSLTANPKKSRWHQPKILRRISRNFPQIPARPSRLSHHVESRLHWTSPNDFMTSNLINEESFGDQVKRFEKGTKLKFVATSSTLFYRKSFEIFNII